MTTSRGKLADTSAKPRKYETTGMQVSTGNMILRGNSGRQIFYDLEDTGINLFSILGHGLRLSFAVICPPDLVQFAEYLTVVKLTSAFFHILNSDHLCRVGRQRNHNERTGPASTTPKKPLATISTVPLLFPLTGLVYTYFLYENNALFVSSFFCFDSDSLS